MTSSEPFGDISSDWANVSDNDASDCSSSGLGIGIDEDEGDDSPDISSSMSFAGFKKPEIVEGINSDSGEMFRFVGHEVSGSSKTATTSPSKALFRRAIVDIMMSVGNPGIRTNDSVRRYGLMFKRPRTIDPFSNPISTCSAERYSLYLGR